MMKKLKAVNYKYSTVLLIDDNELDNFINQKVMEAHCFAETIYTASNGRSAIDLIKNLQLIAEETFPEIIFIDLNMPLLDGFQFIEYCLSEPTLKDRKTKLVVLTSSVNDDDKKRVEAYKQNITFLHKPLSPKILEFLVAQDTP
jgi:CheY-like chemotaxis protein